MSRIIGFDPITHPDDRVLILGSMPSVESLKQSFYYANKTNRFWKMLEVIFDQEADTIEQRLLLLEQNQIALWDVCHSCLRKTSADADIRDVMPNDIEQLLKEHDSIQKVICNGKTSATFMKKFYKDIPIVVCPSTSAANARYRLNDLVEIYGKELKDHE
ncbi:MULTISPECIES: DNA-deoxyinosine glycosylase [Faecalicoccus]|uniref:DNA-deoxyinosine glycosylase n=2 Tax=Faecalicoccus pleomorphus TaxID=1323 RepID=A0AAW6CT26_9FIRM|nr:MULTISPECIES: DNA-deoxyinosine glycosylase [Faecalicoccus]MCI6379818.1 DNA-deoxyinosine glycosylase [Erysipelotrichaceae bacterium]MDB7979316.1 DNA-deoxyinosine glycosylase [Faecalicoccus pleomorphus]MDB7981552.1 DNA-deoxyinosine glycosylase [Faecalicoccus pleomorphus]MDY4869515.1 DNA-deoxyinosine glycosylase [Faecalicoccus sp.]